MRTIDYFVCSLSSSVYKAYLVSHVICSSERKHKVQWKFPGQFLGVCIGAKIRLSLSLLFPRH